MEAFASYLMKSAIWLTGFAVVYFIFLRNERYFMLKRIYLISGILISLIFPLISFYYQVEMPAPAMSQIDMSGAGGTAIQKLQQNISGKPFDYRLILLFLYLSGITLLLVRSIQHFSKIFKTISKANINERGPAKLIRASQFPTSFSFFNYIFINPSVSENETEEIMNHEIVHVRQKHWFDLLLVEILRLIQWVNPFAWIYTRFIRLNHEYLADQAALQRTASPANYRAALLNQLFDSPVISLSNSFNYSLNKKRFDMMKKIITSPYRKLKVLLVLPIFAIVFYAFATPKYHYIPSATDLVTVTTIPADIQKGVKGIVLDEKGKPIKGVHVTSTGNLGNAKTAYADDDGRFELTNIQADALLLFFCRGYNNLTLKPDFKKEMKVIMFKDPDYKETDYTNTNSKGETPVPITVLDGKITDQPASVLLSKMGAEIGTVINLKGKEATDKYGEVGKNGVTEIYSRKKAAELGIKVPFRRQKAEDFPTFRGGNSIDFTNWVIGQIQYPPEAIAKNSFGRVSVNFIVEPDGSISKATAFGNSDSLLGAAVIKAVLTSPKWESAKNPEVKEPYSATVNVKFTLPDKIISDDAFVVVEHMPMYPGGDVELLNFIKANTKYPELVKSDKIEGRVIVRFIVNTEGNTEDVTVIKGVHPLLDKEAVRVVNLLKGFTPGSQGGKAVPVYYMVPITFSLSDQKPIFSGSSQLEVLKFLAQNTNYPREALNSSDTGSVYIIVKMNKGGTIKECSAVNDITGSTVPVMNEVVIVGYKTSSGLQSATTNKNTTLIDYKALQAEGIRIAKKLGELNLPEWKDKDREFVLSFKFVIK